MHRLFSPFASAIAAALAGMTPIRDSSDTDPRLLNLKVSTRRTGKHSHARGGVDYRDRTPRGQAKERARIIHRSRVTLQQAAGLESRAISQECAKRKARTNDPRALVAMAEKRVSFLRRGGLGEMANDIERRVSRAKLILRGIA